MGLQVPAAANKVELRGGVQRESNALSTGALLKNIRMSHSVARFFWPSMSQTASE